MASFEIQATTPEERSVRAWGRGSNYPIGERRHLLNLGSGFTGTYRGNHNLRSELRRLRSFDLIRMNPGKHVAEMKDESTFDLKDFCRVDHAGATVGGKNSRN